MLHEINTKRISTSRPDVDQIIMTRDGTKPTPRRRYLIIIGICKGFDFKRRDYAVIGEEVTNLQFAVGVRLNKLY